MKTLQSLTADDVTGAHANNRAIQFTVPEEATGFAKALPNLDFSKPTEIPPSPVVLTRDVLAWAFLSARDISGRYALIVLVVYYLGGKIFYTRSPNGDYDAAVTWAPAV
jgi:hypothetical protein